MVRAEGPCVLGWFFLQLLPLVSNKHMISLSVEGPCVLFSPRRVDVALTLAAAEAFSPLQQTRHCPHQLAVHRALPSGSPPCNVSTCPGLCACVRVCMCPWMHRVRAHAHACITHAAGRAPDGVGDGSCGGAVGDGSCGGAAEIAATMASCARPMQSPVYV